MIRFTHFNFNVVDLEKSIRFYRDALNLTPTRELDDPEGAFKLVYLSDGKSDFALELTHIKPRAKFYNLGECASHIACETDEFDVLYQKHKEMGIIVYENTVMGIYYIADPDGYWIEIVPKK